MFVFFLFKRMVFFVSGLFIRPWHMEDLSFAVQSINYSLLLFFFLRGSISLLDICCAFLFFSRG